MRRTLVECDRCKRAIAPGSEPTELAVESGPPVGHRNALDLCPECRRDLDRWLSASALSAAPLRRATA